MTVDVQALELILDELRAGPFLKDDQLQLLPRIAAEATDAAELLKVLVRENWLTRYQARKILSGKTNDLLFDHFVILDKLGEGGMGKVYKANQVRLHRHVALKVIRPELLTHDITLKRFQREATISAQLEHPNIVRVFDAGEDRGRFFIAMEFVGGCELGSWVAQRGVLPCRTACEIIRQTALGLDYAHSRDLIHRDIKPSNLLVVTNRSQSKLHPLDGGTVKILDLGLARLLESKSGESQLTALTQDGTVIGTPDYMSPEQAKNSSNVDGRSDLYALGCTFYYLLTGKSPFHAGATVVEKLIQHQVDEPPPVTNLRPDLPPDVAAIIHCLLNKMPEDRFQTGRELADVLAPWAQPPQPVVKPAPARIAIAVEPTPIREEFNFDSRFDDPPAPVRKASEAIAAAAGSKKRWGIIGAAAVLLIGLLALLFANSPKSNNSEPQRGQNENPTAKNASKPIAKSTPKNRQPGRLEQMLPKDTALVVSLDLKKFFAAELVANDLLPLLQSTLNKFKSLTGIDVVKAEDRLTAFATSAGASSLSLLIEGSTVNGENLSKFALLLNEDKAFKPANGSALRCCNPAGEPVYLALCGENRQTLILSKSAAIVEEVLSKIENASREVLEDERLVAQLAKLEKASATGWLAVGKSARLGTDPLEKADVSGLYASLLLTGKVELSIGLEGGSAFQLDQFIKSLKSMLAAGLQAELGGDSLLSRRLGKALAAWQPKAIIERDRRPAAIRYEVQFGAELLRELLNLANDTRDSFLNRFAP